MNVAETSEIHEQKNIYSRIQPDLSNFTIQELEKALQELEKL